MLSSTDKTSSPVHDSIISNRRRRTSRQRRRQRRRSDAVVTSGGSSSTSSSMMSPNDFDRACEFLHHFHSIASRSLDAIAEHSESSGDDDDLDSSFTRLANSNTRIRKAATCACLSSMEVPTTATTSLVDAFDASALITADVPQQQQDDEWGFYFEDMPSEPSEITPKTK